MDRPVVNKEMIARIDELENKLKSSELKVSDLTLEDKRDIIDTERYTIMKGVNQCIIPALIAYYQYGCRMPIEGSASNYMNDKVFHKMYNMLQEFTKLFDDVDERVYNMLQSDITNEKSKASVPKRSRFGNNPIPERNGFLNKKGI